MPAPRKSLRPKKRPKWMDEKAMLDNEGPTRGYEEDRQRMQGYMDGGEIRRGDVRDNSKRGKCY